MGSYMTVERSQAGRYVVSFESGLFPNGYKVIVCGYGSWTIDARVFEVANDHFSIGMSDDETGNDSNCEIMVLAPIWSYNA